MCTWKEVYSSSPSFFAFRSLEGATVSLPSRYHPLINGQSERMNPELEKGCLVAQTFAQWFGNLLWVEFTHKFLLSVSAGFSSLKCIFDYQLPLFLVLE